MSKRGGGVGGKNQRGPSRRGRSFCSKIPAQYARVCTNTVLLKIIGEGWGRERVGEGGRGRE